MWMPLFRDWRQEEGFRVKELEFGPGLPVFYFQGDGFDEVSFLADVFRNAE